MKNEFVTIEIAKTLKKMGFNEPCFAYYCCPLDDLKFSMNGRNEVTTCTNKEFGLSYTAPTWFNAINWLRNTYGIHIFVDWCDDDFNVMCVSDIYPEETFDYIYHKTIEEAYVRGFEDAFSDIVKYNVQPKSN